MKIRALVVLVGDRVLSRSVAYHCPYCDYSFVATTEDRRLGFDATEFGRFHEEKAHPGTRRG